MPGLTRWYDPYLKQFSSPDSLIPDPYNSLDYNRYDYARSNPLKYTDPSGHWPDLIGGYIQGWSNFGSAITTLQNQNASVGGKVFALGYIGVWGGAHLALGIGIGGLACAAAGPGCVAAVEGALGIGAGINADGNPTNEIEVVADTGKTILEAVSKPDARAALKAGLDGLTNDQVQKALDLMGKGKMDNVTIKIMQNGNAQVVTQVPGGDGSSFVRYFYTLDPSGKVIDILQRGFNAAGELIHVHDKLEDIITPK